MFQVYNIDAKELVSKLPDNSVDLVYTDPPFGVYGKIKHQFTRINDRRSIERSKQAFYSTPKDIGYIIEQFKRILKPGSPVITFTSTDVLCETIGYYNKFFSSKEHKLAIYARQIGALGTFRSTYEPMLIFFNPTKNKARYIAKAQELNNEIGKNYVKDVIFAKKDYSIRFRGRKAVSALVPYIVYFTKVGDTVLDPFMGTGSTGEAALSLGRNFIGSEIDRTVFEIARARLRAIGGDGNNE